MAFEKHPDFEVDGHDIASKVSITPWEAALGANVPVRTLGGTLDVKIPPGSQGGRKLRLRGRGLPGKTPGDHTVEVQISTPPVNSPADRTVYEDMARHFHYDPRH